MDITEEMELTLNLIIGAILIKVLIITMDIQETIIQILDIFPQEILPHTYIITILDTRGALRRDYDKCENVKRGIKIT